MLRSKIEALADDHPSKPKCLSRLAHLFEGVGNFAEQKRLMTHALELERRRKDDLQIAAALRGLSTSNRLLHLYSEGIQQAKEALEISERINDAAGQARSLSYLAYVLFEGGQFDAAKHAASRAIDLIVEEDQEYLACSHHRVLGRIFGSKGERREAIHHFETALRIASSFNWCEALFWTHHDAAELFDNQGELEDANSHIERAKSYAVDRAFQYELGRATRIQANVWYQQHRLEDAKSEALHSLEIFEKLGAAEGARYSRELLQKVERAMDEQPTRPRSASRNDTTSYLS